MDHTAVVVTLIAAIFGCSGFWSFVQMRIVKHDKTKTASDRGMIALLHNEIYPLCEEYIMRGSVSFDEFDNLTYLYEPYVGLGGNGTGKSMYKRVEALPRTKTKDTQNA